MSADTTASARATGAGGHLLSLDGVRAGYHGKSVIRDVNLHVDRGELVVLIGPNGAGKSTTLRCISGMVPLLAGTATLDGTSLAGMAPHRIARRGIAHVPEDRSLFRGLTVRENLAVPGRRGAARRAVDTAAGHFPELGRLLDRQVGLLSGGEQQMLAVSRALVVQPSLIIVDEMSMGLAPIVVRRLLDVLRTVASAGEVGVLLVEQHVPLVLPKADRAYILVHGEPAYSGPAAGLLRDPDLIAATYLGGDRLTSVATVH